MKPSPRIIWMGTPVHSTFPASPGHRNSQDGAIEDLRSAGFAVDECETVAQMEELLASPVSFARHIGAVVSGAVDSAHTAFVTRFRRLNQTMFLAVYDRDAALSAEMRTMLKSRAVDMVTCWSEHLVHGMQGQNASAEAVGDSLIGERARIHEIFTRHDNAPANGYIEGDEQYEFAVDVAKLIVPEDGPERTELLHKIWDIMLQIDTDGDQRISFNEFWRFVTSENGPVKIVDDAPPVKASALVNFTAFVCVVVQRADGSFVLVDTPAGWWLVGGELGLDEAPEHAAIRFTREQAGIDVRLEGILRVEFDYRSAGAGARLKTIFLARPLNDYDPIKTVPDAYSAGSVWVNGASVTVDNPRIPLAGSEPAVWFEYMLRLGAVFPLEVLTGEGAAPHAILPSAKAHSPFGGPHCVVEQGGEFGTALGPIYPNSP